MVVMMMVVMMMVVVMMVVVEMEQSALHLKSWPTQVTLVIWRGEW